MSVSEAIRGLGSHAAQDLLKLSGLEDDSPDMVGPEFTYLGIFLSALAYKNLNNPNLNVGVASLDALRPLHSKAGESDAKMLDLIAGASLLAYDEAIAKLPETSGRSAIAVTLCDVLADLLKRSSGTDLTLFQKAKLRSRIAVLIEVLETAHREMGNRVSGTEDPSNTATFMSSKNSLLDEIQSEKLSLLTQFEDGYFTTREYHQRLEKLNRSELAIHLETAKKIYSTSNLWSSKFAVVVAAAFILGFFISPWLHPRLFGYSNAEECALSAKNRDAVDACYDLYPSIKE